MTAEENVLDVDEEDFRLAFCREVEKAFGIKLTDEEIEAFETVGDVFAVIRTRLNSVERAEALPCFTAASFYTLRRAMLDYNPSARVEPKSLLRDLIVDAPLAKVWYSLGEQSKLKLPQLYPTRASATVATSTGIVFALIGGFFAFDNLSIDFTRGPFGAVLSIILQTLPGLFVGALAGLVPAFFVLACGPKQIPEDIKTFGDLASATAKLNLGSHANTFGAVRNRDIWSSLVYLVDRHNWSKIKINRDTRFFPAKLDPPTWLSSR
jgi:hypothetical protein